MARMVASVTRSEIPSLRCVRMSSSFGFAFAAKFEGLNPKIFLLLKVMGLQFFAFKAGFVIIMAGRRTRAMGAFPIGHDVLRLKRSN